ncbi:hypothetical protein F0Q45_21795 [Mycobacterium simiae]|uniref:Uncharacterized protein n=1 Tax=Mycobacterium simiae TaxID=1784 RepID=A0A5B1BJP6_MYCSI|nr:hypothetical protein [Mycobacterium simiae]KAA1248231.1 hypothetical protein F0Q45_21795 [Mycobacterium simiae]
MRSPAPPPWMADIPPLHNPRAKALAGLPSHAASHWEAGGPVFSVDPRKMRILAIRGRCWQCGYPLAGPGYVIITEGNNGQYGALHVQDFGPLHRSCALYACAGACPFLRYPTSRRRLTADHRQRGTATVQGFTTVAVVFPPGLITVPRFGYHTPAEAISITNLARTAELYAQAVTDDAATRFTATPRLHWTDTPNDTARLAADWTQTKNTLQTWAQTSVVTIDGQIYRGHTINQQRQQHPTRQTANSPANYPTQTVKSQVTATTATLEATDQRKQQTGAGNPPPGPTGHRLGTAKNAGRTHFGRVFALRFGAQQTGSQGQQTAVFLPVGGVIADGPETVP